MKMIRLYLVLAILTFAAPSCNNDDETAPPITQENTFSCKINGKLFVPEDHGGFPVIKRGVKSRVSEANDWTFIFGNAEATILIYAFYVIDIGLFPLSPSDGDGFFFKNQKT